MAGLAMAGQQQVAEFWQWFQSVCGQFGATFENRELVDELDARIATLGSFSWELGPGVRDDKNSALVLTPGGDPDLLRETRQVIAIAPECPGWEFYPAKPPKKWQREFSLQKRDGTVINVNASGAWYVLFKYPDGVFDVLLADRNLAALSEDHQQTAAVILLDGELGEERRMAIVHSVDIVGQFEDDMKRKSSAIVSLAAHVQSFIT